MWLDLLADSLMIVEEWSKGWGWTNAHTPSDASSSLALGTKQILSASFGLKRSIISSESLLCLGKEELPCSSVRLGLAYQVAKVVWDLVEVDGRCCWGFCGL